MTHAHFYLRTNMLMTLFIISTLSIQAAAQESPSRSYSYRQQLSGITHSLSVTIEQINTRTGTIRLNGVDTKSPKAPFSFDWGDGTTTSGTFPQSHRYRNTKQNYIVTVTAFYSGGKYSYTRSVARFGPTKISPVRLSPDTTVTIPSEFPSLGTRVQQLKSNLTTFNDSYFSQTSRSTVEYVLSIAAQIQIDLVNNDVLLVDDAFNQLILRSPGSGGAFSIWYANPPSVGAGDYVFKGQIQYSSLFHEMGHNFTLNTPANYIYGGKSDGNANAIYSESIAQIIQHVTAAELINRYQEFGLPEDLVLNIALTAEQSMGGLLSSYNAYLAAGMPFASWNSPKTKHDETFGTFMTIAYKFFELAERNNTGYTEPFKRMMELLQTFDIDSHERYDPHHDTPEAAAFRSTLMVSALAYAFDQDLRQEFRELNFPIDETMYRRLRVKRKIAAQKN